MVAPGDPRSGGIALLKWFNGRTVEAQVRSPQDERALLDLRWAERVGREDECMLRLTATGIVERRRLDGHEVRDGNLVRRLDVGASEPHENDEGPITPRVPIGPSRKAHP